MPDQDHRPSRRVRPRVTLEVPAGTSVSGPFRRERTMKVLVTAASRYGATAEIAEALADALRENGVGAAAVAPADVTSLASYDAVVLGSGVYAGRWLPPARDLAHRLAGELTDRPVWLFSSGPVGGRPKPPAIPT